MRFAAIVGAGELGATIAREIAARGRLAEVRLIDDASDIAAGKALDIQQAGPLENSPTRVTAFADLTAAAGAAAILLADRAQATSRETSWGPPSGGSATPARQTALGTPAGGRLKPPTGFETSYAEWSGDAGLTLVRRLAGLDREGVIVCAGGSQHDVLERGLRELHLSRARFFGSAPEAIVLALRALVAVEADVSPSVVALTVLGRIPDRVVVPWKDATIAGRPLHRVLNPAQVARIERRAAAAGSPGPYTLAAAAARVAEMLILGSRKVVCCTVGLEGEFGMRRTLSSLPVMIDIGGIVRVIAPALEGREQVLLENAVGESTENRT